MTRHRLVTAVLLLTVMALFAVPRFIDGGTSPYAGSDSQATEVIAETGYAPWFESVFAPSSTEVESGLFALQAALGGGVLGYVLGRLRGRRPARNPGEASRGEASG